MTGDMERLQMERALLRSAYLALVDAEIKVGRVTGLFFQVDQQGPGSPTEEFYKMVDSLGALIRRVKGLAQR